MEQISVQELRQRMEAGEPLHILDVREPAEYEQSNIGGKLLPLGRIMSMQVDEIEDWKDEEVIVHCKAGGRSTQAAMMLETMGFKNVKNLTGGMLAWEATAK